MATDKDQLRTKLTRPPSRPAAADPEGPGFVRSGKHDPGADGERLAAQGRVEQLLDRGIEGIEVRMENGGCCFHPDRSTGLGADRELARAAWSRWLDALFST